MINNQRTRIKICGLTRPEDVLNAVNLGVDAIGMVFYPASKRYVSLPQAQQLRRLVPAFVSFTALFVNPAERWVNSILKAVKPDLLQFHGDETAQFCASFNHPYIKAFRVGGPQQDSPQALANFCKQYSDAAGWLFDSYTAGYGGSGESFTDDLLQTVLQQQDRPALILSGGLQIETVGRRISLCRPFAVDTSSAVESAPGLKDKQKMHDFIKAVQNADNIVK